MGGYAFNCYKSGLSSMATNTCYKMNPARGTSPTWITNVATDTWWWSKASCSTGALLRLNALPAAPRSESAVEFDLLGRPQ